MTMQGLNLLYPLPPLSVNQPNVSSEDTELLYHITWIIEP